MSDLPADGLLEAKQRRIGRAGIQKLDAEGAESPQTAVQSDFFIFRATRLPRHRVREQMSISLCDAGSADIA